jgi:excisionase family DNA binding protein
LGFPASRCHILKRCYRVDEAAVYFAISVMTLYRLLDKGDLIGMKIRGCLGVSLIVRLKLD